ncbi:MAG: M14 family zinc carboxypeptidase [Pseudomonadota bacterium]
MANKVIAGIVLTVFALPAHGQILTYTENVNSDTELAVGYPIPVPVNSLTQVDGFRLYDSLFAQHQSLWLNNEEVAGSVVGTTHLGREIWAYSLGDTDNTTLDGNPEPAVLINGGIHAREWASPEVVTALYEVLVANKSDAHIHQYLIENLNTVVIPVLNVDGFIQTQNFPINVTPTPDTVQTSTSPPQFQQPRDGRMRRKNMRDVDEDLNTADDRLLGIDLNRNNAQFFENGSNSTDVTSLVYRGAFPASEPEIVALQAAAEIAPADRLRLYIDAHSFSRVYFIPSPLNARQNANTNTLVTRMAGVTRAFGNPEYFPVFNEPNTGISGTASFFAHTYLIPAWTLEIEPPSGFPNLPRAGAFYGGFGVSHDGFILPDSEVERVRTELNASHILGLYHQAGPPNVTQLQILDGNNVVYDALWEPQNDGTRSLNISTNQTLQPGRQYSLAVSFNKPMRFLNDQGVVASYPGLDTLVDIFPRVSIQIPQSNGEIRTANVNFNADAWATAPGGGPGQYKNYVTDTIEGTFNIAEQTRITTTTSSTINVNMADMAGLLVDADPATSVDWANGGWTNYDNGNGQTGDIGGIDTSYAVQVQAPAGAADSSGGGGGGFGVLLLGLFFLSAAKQIRQKSR